MSHPSDETTVIIPANKPANIIDRGHFFIIHFKDGKDYKVEAFNYCRACAIAAFFRLRDGSYVNHASLAVVGGEFIGADEGLGAITIEDAIRP